MIELLIPLQIPSHNELNEMHWAARHKSGKLWEQWIRYTLRPGNLAAATGKRHVSILAFRKRRITDCANLVAGCKHAVDALVRCGLLVDDTDELVSIHYDQQLASKSPTGKVCTRITITDAV